MVVHPAPGSPQARWSTRCCIIFGRQPLGRGARAAGDRLHRNRQGYSAWLGWRNRMPPSRPRPTSSAAHHGRPRIQSRFDHGLPVRVNPRVIGRARRQFRGRWRAQDHHPAWTRHKTNRQRQAVLFPAANMPSPRDGQGAVEGPARASPAWLETGTHGTSPGSTCPTLGHAARGDPRSTAGGRKVSRKGVGHRAGRG